jgi:hypothetical protein
MQFVVPQFEHEAKVIGPLTFGQFIYVGIAGGICFALYFILPTPFFIAACIILLGGAASLVFLKINGRPLPAILGSLIKFNLTTKIYIWKKKEMPITIVKNKPAGNREEELPLKMAGGSQLNRIKTKIESKKN